MRGGVRLDAGLGAVASAHRQGQAGAMSSLETVSVTTSQTGAATIELNRPQRMNAWTPQLAQDLLAALSQAAEQESIRAVMLTGAGRGFSSGADLKEGGAGELLPTGRPERLQDADRALPPRDEGDQGAPEAGDRGGRWRRGGGWVLARALLRPGARVAERLLPARLREHRPGPRRRILAARAEQGRHGARGRDGDAGRAHPGTPRRWNGG